MIKLSIGWNFKNSYIQLPPKMYTLLNPTPVEAPKAVIINECLAQELGLSNNELQSSGGIEILAGNEVPEGAEPLAQAYAGHQFGHFNRLGDGRAILLGEHMTPNGERFDIQLKGSGRTPYSRGGDGRAALGPMLREYLISEAMFGLRIPTTRSLAVVETGETIIRDRLLPGAILTRVAQSHLRVGTFQFIAQFGTYDEAKALADYAINRHYPEVLLDDQPYLAFFKEVIKKQASLIAKWQLVGFVHGVMNTDNMTISGETIDYGPCAFMDTYHLATVFSSIDYQGRYAYGNQPYMASWNLARLAESILPLLNEDEEQALKLAKEALSTFATLYQHNWREGIKGKLGLVGDEAGDEELVKELLDLMQEGKADYTNTFRSLTLDLFDEMKLFQTNSFKDWYHKWQERLKIQQESNDVIKERMRKHNPAIIPRNYLVEEALQAAEMNKDLSKINELLNVFKNPYAYTKDQEKYAKLPPVTDEPYQTFCGT